MNDIVIKNKNIISIRKNFYLFIAPWLIGFILLNAIPMLISLVMSLTKWDMITEVEWVGLKNFIDIFTNDPLFYKSLGVTFLWASFLPIGIIFALFLANLLNRKMIGTTIFRTIVYIPVIVPAVANCLLWNWMFNIENGLLNMILNSVGLSSYTWLMSEKSVMFSLIIMSLWQVGANVVIFLAALQGVDKTLIEAAEIDGAGMYVKYFRITLPLISPAIFFQLIMGIIGALQVFMQGQLMTDGGPNKSTLFYILYLYRKAFEQNDMGYASGLAWILFAIIMIITIIVFKTIGKKVYYEN